MNCLYNVLIPRDTSHTMLPYNCLYYLLLLLSFSKNSSEQFRNHVGNTTLSEQFRNHVGSTTLSEQFGNHVENTTLSEQFRNHVGNIILSEQFRNHLGNTTLSEQFRNHVEKYHTVRTVPKSCRRISHCQNSSEIM